MKTFVKLTALALALVFCVAGFAACNGTGDKVILIGGSGPLTGANSQYGSAVYNGAKLAIDEINAKGGYNGYTFVLDMKQDDCGSTQAENAYYALEEAGMKISIGSVTSGSAKAFADAAKEDNLFCLTPSASADNVIGAGNHSFRVCFGDPQQGTLAADELVTNKGFTKIGVIYDNSDDYSTGLYNAFEAQMTALNKVKGTDYVVYTFDAESKIDFSVQVAGIKDAGCDAIFLPIYYGEAALIAKAAATYDETKNLPILGCDGLDGIAAQLDSSVVAEVRYFTPFDINSTETKVQNFVAKYREAYDLDPNQFAADAYDAIMIIYEALVAGEIDVEASASEICNALAAQLTGGTFKYSGLTGDNMTWETSGSVVKEAKIVKVQ